MQHHLRKAFICWCCDYQKNIMSPIFRNNNQFTSKVAVTVYCRGCKAKKGNHPFKSYVLAKADNIRCYLLWWFMVPQIKPRNNHSNMILVEGISTAISNCKQFIAQYLLLQKIIYAIQINRQSYVLENYTHIISLLLVVLILSALQ